MAERVVGEDGEEVRYVSEAGEEEEEAGQSFGGLATVVEQDLWKAGTEVEQGTSVAKDLTPERKLQSILVRVVDWTLVMLLATALGTAGYPPAKDTGYNDHHDGEGVEGDGFGPGVDFTGWQVFWCYVFVWWWHERGSRRQVGNIDIGPRVVDVWTMSISIGSIRAKKRLSLSVGVRRNNLVVPGKAAVVEALTQKYNIGEEVVHGENDHCWQDALKDAADDIEEVT